MKLGLQKLAMLICIFCLIGCGVLAKPPQQEQDFNVVLQDILVLTDIEVPSNLQSVAFKTIGVSETLRNKRNSQQFHGVRVLRDMLGDKRQKLDTTFVYLNKGEPLVAQSFSTWHVNNIQDNSVSYRLYYPKTPVAYAMDEDDLLFIAKTRDNKLFVIVVNSKSPVKDKLLAALNAENPGKSWYQVFFTPGPDCENNIISRLNNAKKTVDIAVFSITNNNIADAILAAHKRGVKVRIITDVEQSKWRTSLVDELAAEGIPVRMNSELVYGAQHDKFAIFDGKEMTTGSFNWTNSATKNNCENCIFFTQSGCEYSDRFKFLWKVYE